MDAMTAYRSFGKPGFTPVKHVKVFNDRFYRCTFQNVETDPRVDYVGLAEGEYVQILPGAKAREARDAHLNHLNRMEEWTGPVFAVKRPQWNMRPEYVGSLAEADALKKKWEADNATSLQKALEAIAKEMRKSDGELIAVYGNCQGWPGHETQQVAKMRQEHEESRTRNTAYWNEPVVISEVRSAVASRAVASPRGGTPRRGNYRSKPIKRPRLTR